MHSYDSFTELYLSCLREITTHGRTVPGVSDPHSVGSHFGKKTRSTKELVGYGFSLPNPEARMLDPSVKRTNLGFAIANAIWVLSGSSELQMILRYNERGKLFSRDGITLEGAFGPRLFGAAGVWPAARQLLLDDNASRRAFMPLFDQSDILTVKLDTPCAVGLHLLIRNDTLEILVIMRAQSAAMVMPYDVFLFCFLQECLAIDLGVKPGAYHHFSSSCHYYEDEIDTVARTIKQPLPSTPLPKPPKLESFSNEIILEISAAERDVSERIMKNPFEEFHLDPYSLPEDWRLLLAVLRASQRQVQLGKPLPSDIDSLPQSYRTFFQ